jgi:signal transduction histidine kinase
MRLTFTQTIVAASVIAVAMMTGLGFLSLQDIGKQAETSLWVEHSQIIITRLQTLLTGVEQASTGVRGYILTRDPDFLGDLSEVQSNLSRRIRLLQNLTADNPQRQVDIPAIANLLTQYLIESNRLIGFLKNTSPHAALSAELKVNSDLLHQIEAQIKAVQMDERELLRGRIAASQRTAQTTASVIQIGSICGILLLLGSTYLLTKETIARQLVDERIKKLNRELAQRAGQLEMSNTELEAFTYTVSHDLRAPLRHIHGFVEILQKSPAVQAEAENQRYMNVIAKAAKHMGLLIDSLLDLSRTGRVELRPVPLDMRKLIDKVIEELEPEWKDRHITWDIHPLASASGDSTLVRQVWMNLITNALKYSRPREEARVEIGQSDAKTDAGEVTYYVRDNGVGFDMKYADKLFGVFQRLHRDEDFEGTGIGLANVRRIVSRHGGRVWAESELDAGAVFHFSLPRAPFAFSRARN